MYADKTHLMDDKGAEALVGYARALANAGRSDAVALVALDDHGNEVNATFLLNPSSILLIESTTSSVEAPSNDEAVERMRGLTERLENPANVQPEDGSPEESAVVGPDDY
jgi:hypothetical protein